jgi:hypothetical protein
LYILANNGATCPSLEIYTNLAGALFKERRFTFTYKNVSKQVLVRFTPNGHCFNCGEELDNNGRCTNSSCSTDSSGSEGSQCSSCGANLDEYGDCTNSDCPTNNSTDKFKCPNCESEVPDGTSICGCGYVFGGENIFCSNCNALVTNGEYCTACGTTI